MEERAELGFAAEGDVVWCGGGRKGEGERVGEEGGEEEEAEEG